MTQNALLQSNFHPRNDSQLVGRKFSRLVDVTRLEPRPSMPPPPSEFSRGRFCHVTPIGVCQCRRCERSAGRAIKESGERTEVFDSGPRSCQRLWSVATSHSGMKRHYGLTLGEEYVGANCTEQRKKRREDKARSYEK